MSQGDIGLQKNRTLWAPSSKYNQLLTRRKQSVTGTWSRPVSVRRNWIVPPQPQPRASGSTFKHRRLETLAGLSTPPVEISHLPRAKDTAAPVRRLGFLRTRAFLLLKKNMKNERIPDRGPPSPRLCHAEPSLSLVSCDREHRRPYPDHCRARGWRTASSLRCRDSRGGCGF